MDCLGESVDRRKVASSTILFVSEGIKSLICMCSVVSICCDSIHLFLIRTSCQISLFVSKIRSHRAAGRVFEHAICQADLAEANLPVLALNLLYKLMGYRLFSRSPVHSLVFLADGCIFA